MRPAASRTICIGSWYWRRNACQRDSAFASVNLFGPWRARRSAASALVRPLSGSTPRSRTAPSSESTCQTGASVVGVEGLSVIAIRVSSQAVRACAVGARGDARLGSGEPASPEQVIGSGRQLPAAGTASLRFGTSAVDAASGVAQPVTEARGGRDLADDLEHRLSRPSRPVGLAGGGGTRLAAGGPPWGRAPYGPAAARSRAGAA